MVISNKCILDYEINRMLNEILYRLKEFNKPEIEYVKEYKRTDLFWKNKIKGEYLRCSFDNYEIILNFSETIPLPEIFEDKINLCIEVIIPKLNKLYL